MTDRELLEMAAKAAGITNLQWESDGTMQNRMNRLTIPYECQGMMTGIDWNPLRDDGDALRLAVKLHMKLEKVVSCLGSAWVADGRCMESVGSDQMASVRRAIVRAAAAIGSAM